MPLPFLLRRSWESGGFRQSPPGALIYGFPSRKPHGPLPGRWRFRTVPLGMGAMP